MEARPEPSRSVRGTRLPPEYAGLPLTVEKLPTIDLKERSPPSFDRTLFYLAAGISLSLADDRPPFNTGEMKPSEEELQSSSSFDPLGQATVAS